MSDPRDTFAASLRSDLGDALHAWFRRQPHGEVPTASGVDAAIDLASATASHLNMEERNNVVAEGVLSLLEGSGCDVAVVLEMVRENMAEHMVPAGRA